MNVIKTSLDGVVIIEPRLFEDSRGYFFESFNQREFDEKVCKTVFVQDNESMSRYGVIRALHLQRPPYAQSKLVRVVKEGWTWRWRISRTGFGIRNGELFLKFSKSR